MGALLILFIFSIFLSPTLSLNCYVCKSTATNEECNTNSQTCLAPLDTCMSIVDTYGSTKAIVKTCASKATCSGASAMASVDTNGNGNAIICCSSDFCNLSGATIAHIHTLMLVLAPSVLLLLILH